MLDRYGAALVWADPGPISHERATGGWLYLRFHRADFDGSWEYGRERLRPWAERIAGSDAEEVFVYFNNDPGGCDQGCRHHDRTAHRTGARSNAATLIGPSLTR